MRRVAPAVHEDDRDAGEARRERLAQVGFEARLVERANERAVGRDALVGFDHARVEQLGQDDAPLEQARPILVGDAQRVAKAAA